MVKSDKITKSKDSERLADIIMDRVSFLQEKHPASLWHWDILVSLWQFMCLFREDYSPGSLLSELYLEQIRLVEDKMIAILSKRIENRKELTKEMASFTKFDPENPKIELNKSRDLKEYDSEEIKWGVSYSNWISLSKQAKVEHLAGMAREDRGLSYHVWHNNFKLEFPEGYSVEMGRYKKKFRRSNRGEHFAINGLAFYKKNR